MEWRKETINRLKTLCRKKMLWCTTDFVFIHLLERSKAGFFHVFSDLRALFPSFCLLLGINHLHWLRLLGYILTNSSNNLLNWEKSHFRVKSKQIDSDFCEKKIVVKWSVFLIYSCWLHGNHTASAYWKFFLLNDQLRMAKQGPEIITGKFQK